MITMGTVMEIEKKKALVFTLDGGVVFIKPRLGLFVGQQITFSRKELVQQRPIKLYVALPTAVAAVLIVAMVVMSFMGGGFLPVQKTGQCAAFIALDINPSVQFRIDGDGAVISADALNEDGRSLLAGLRLAGKPVNTAVDEALKRARELGYLQDESGVVLVAGALNDDNTDIYTSRSAYQAKLQTILREMNNSGGADVLAFYIDDSTVKQKADRSGISLGRELLREYAEQNNIEVDDDEIRSGRIADLLDKIGDSAANCLPEVTPQPTETADPTDTPTESPTTEPTKEPTNEPTLKPTNSPEPTKTVEPTEKPTAAPTAKPTVSGVAASAVRSGIKVTWPKATAGDGSFLYYKIVLSVNDATPKYPDNGYAKVISDKFTLSTVVVPNSEYHGGDLGGKVKAGVSYYVSVTYVYENEVRSANAVRVKCPEPEPEPTVAPTTAPSGSDYSVSAFVSDDSIRIKWDKSPTAEGFNYYKVVLSRGDSSPKYPDNGYLYAISNIDTTACTASPGDGYNGGDIGGTLKAGQTYYISVTYVYDGYKKYGNTVRVKMPGEPEPETPPTEFTGPTCSASFDGSTLSVSWRRLPADTVSCGGRSYTDFQYYKVVVADHANPKYPDDGYVDVVSDINDGSSSVTLSGEQYVSGTTWYVAITYVFSDGKIYSADVAFTIP